MLARLREDRPYDIMMWNLALPDDCAKCVGTGHIVSPYIVSEAERNAINNRT